MALINTPHTCFCLVSHVAQRIVCSSLLACFPVAQFFYAMHALFILVVCGNVA